MTPDEIGAHLVSLLDQPTAVSEAAQVTAQVTATVSGGGDRYARATVDVPADSWPAALAAARDDADLACDFFDWLSAVDELDDGFAIVAHLWSTRHRHGLLLRTRVPRERPELLSVVDVFPGADWHERETYEMFGVHFVGHPALTPLLLPPEFEGHPLRKEFVLAARVAKPWPGAKEPGEPAGGGGGARRAPMRPPGVPLPTEWGPQAARSAPDAGPDGGTRPARAAGPDGGRPDGGTA
ncbi:NADH-quinone oxidoreductase subunit C [Solwaraspora sp. WMMA2080]|uniref:NADH-quinone oxidoreductase subunit C n=1 Tax=Solwaraspora sp. WMMA2080 TaxID=3015165 RepID=UPI00248BBD1B|nr:NADH-quinone oxidoreductase subunit C [Solwaraspora sp. WMMA2080]WBC19707.1 NADH-quinone oxidoreductase subunit C [Solwaraspora sp. WMMA2080]